MDAPEGHVSYDEFGAHEPPVHHIGHFLGWLARSGHLDDDRFDAELLRGVRSGERPGLDLAPAVGDELSSEVMTPEGRGFSDFYYDRYLLEYDALAPDGAEPTRDRIESLIDERYGQWVARGRPAGKPREAAARPAAKTSGSGRRAPVTAGGFAGSTWVQIQQQKAQLARDMESAFKDDPTRGSAYPEETDDAGTPTDGAPDDDEREEPRKPRWKFWG